MSLAIMLTVQAATIAPITFDLAAARPPAAPSRCGASPSGEIVVCGRTPGAYRLMPIPAADRFAPRPPVAETAIARGVVAGVRASSVAFPNGTVSNRAMVTLKTKF